MINRIDISYKIPDTRALVKKGAFESLGLSGKITQVVVVDSYLIDSSLSNDQIEKVADILTNPLIEKSTINSLPIENEFDYLIEIGLLPGVTDNIGTTARETIEDFIRQPFSPDENVYARSAYFIIGNCALTDINKIADSLYNPLIQQAYVADYKRIIKSGLPRLVPKVSLNHEPKVLAVNLKVTDNELVIIGNEGILDREMRRGPLSLTLTEMKTIRDYFKREKRNPTDIELETLAQTWSEHCQHTIFNDPLDEIKEGLFKKYIKGATEKIRKDKSTKGRSPSGRDFCVSVFTDNSGAIEFDDNYLITHKVETHNSPSALDPFGGALTGIVGVNRDTLGFGLSAKPIANYYGFCFADPNDNRSLYRDKHKKQKMLSPKRILEGVVAGVNVGGNSSGIPTPLGFMYFDDSYKGKPLVFVGTVGLLPKKINNKPSHIKKAHVGDYIVMIGGRVGLDGIHGATFSSEELNIKSQTSSVQIGDPIIQKKLSDAIIRDTRDKGLYNSITDNGAGGLSSSVGEMAKESGGCVVNLEKVPLKYPGLDPWQIWISESQERMTLAIPKNKWSAFAAVMKKHDVEATVIGEFTDSGKCIVNFNKKTVLNLDLNFLHNGRPKKQQVSQKVALSPISQISPISPKFFTSYLEKKLAELNIASYEFISTQFDHTVQGTAVLPPLHGKGRVNSNATVIKPLYDSKKGVVMSYGINPDYSNFDTYYMTAAAVDSAIRGAVSVGGNPDYLALLDNFCWSSSDEPERLYQLKQAAKACYDYAVAYGTPFISGKDSMFNDFMGFDKNGKPVSISVIPTLLISSIGVIDDVSKTVTLDFKKPGDIIYLLGETHDELNTINANKNLKLYRAFYQCAQEELVASSISVSLGGVAVALCKSAIGGMFGCAIDWTDDTSSLLTETDGQLLVSINPKNRTDFEKILSGNSYELIGKVTSNTAIKIIDKNKKAIVNLSLKKALESYKSTFKNY